MTNRNLHRDSPHFTGRRPTRTDRMLFRALLFLFTAALVGSIWFGIGCVSLSPSTAHPEPAPVTWT